MARSTNYSAIKKDIREVAGTLSNLATFIDRIPDKVGKWVPPLKRFYHENKKVISVLGVVDKVTKAQAGKMNLLGAGILKAKLQGAGLGRTFSMLGAAGAYAYSKLVQGARKARFEQMRHAREIKATIAEQKKMAHVERVAKIQSGVGSKRGGVGFGNIALGAAAYGVGSRLSGAVSGALGKGDDLARQSEITGIPVRTLALLRDTADDLGISMDAVGRGMLFMQRNLAMLDRTGGPAADALRRMGVSGTELLEKAPEDQFMAIAHAISSIEDPADRVAASMQLFGLRSGAELIPLFLELKHVDPHHLGRYADALADTAVGFRETSIQARKAKDNISTFAIGVAESLKPVIDAFNKFSEESDIRSKGKGFGGMLRGLASGYVDWLDSFKLFQGTGLSKWMREILEAKPQGELPPMVAQGKNPFAGFKSLSSGDWSPLLNNFLVSGATRRGGPSDPGWFDRARGGGSMLTPAAKRKGLELLPLRERRQIESIRAAQSGTRDASTTSAFGAVKRGDRVRIREVERDRVRMKEGIDILVQKNQEIVNIMKEWNE